MAPTGKEKEKAKSIAELEDAFFEFSDKKEELEMMLDGPTEDQSWDVALLNATMNELADYWKSGTNLHPEGGEV